MLGDMNVQKNSQEYFKPNVEEVRKVDCQNPLQNFKKSTNIQTVDYASLGNNDSLEKPKSILEKMANTLKSFEVLIPSIGVLGGRIHFKGSLKNFKVKWSKYFF